ncbi:MAG: serine-rich protein [Anaerostipes caccae]
MGSMLSIYDIKNILHPKINETPEDDFRIIDSWAEYEEGSKDPTERPLSYLCYELEAVDPQTGMSYRFYKALKFVRVIRLPKGAKQSEAFMDMHSQILSAMYSNNCNFITVIANVIKPVPLGLLYLYGIQGVSTSLKKAKEIAHNNFAGLIGSLQGTYRVLELEIIKAQETEWLREKMYGMEHMTMVRGIPKASKGGEDAGNKGFGGKNLNPDSQGTLEELITGMSDYEYVLEILSTPVYLETLKNWNRKTQEDMTNWYSQLQGQTSLSMNISIPMMYMANASQSQGYSKAYTDADTVSYTQNESYTINHGQSVGESLSQSLGESYGKTHGSTVTDSVSQSHSISNGVNLGKSFGQTLGVNQGSNLGVSQNVGENAGLSQGASVNHSDSQNASFSEGQSQGTSYNLSQGQNVNSSHGIGTNHSVGYGTNESYTVGTNESFGTNESYGTNSSRSHSNSSSTGTNNGWSSNLGLSHNSGVSNGTSTNHSRGTSDSVNAGLNIGILSVGGSEGTNESYGTGTTEGYNSSNGLSFTGGISGGTSHTTGVSDGYTTGNSHTTGTSHTVGISNGLSKGFSQNESFGASENYTVSNGKSLNQSWGANTGTSQSISNGKGISDGWGSNVNMSTGNSYSSGLSQGLSSGQSASQNAATNYGKSFSETLGVTTGRSVGESQSESYSQSISNGYGRTFSQNIGTSQGQGYGTSRGESQSVSNGTTGAISNGMSSSMGFGPSIGYNKSYQWLDQTVQDILELLQFQNERIKRAIRNGAFYTYVYIACSSLDALSTAQAVAKSTWQNDFALTSPLQVLNLSEEEQQHLLYHFSAFSADTTRENFFGVNEYKYTTILLPEEFVAYTHLPRISEGGVFSDVNDIPKFAVPSGLKGEIYMGTVLSAERFTLKNGYKTPFDYRLDEDELMHGFFTGASRSGKTVAAMRFVAELSRVRRKKTGKRLRIICMDPKQDWRTLARFIEPERFRFYSLGNMLFRPIKINPCKIPRGVQPQYWIDGLIDIYCRAYGLLERGKQMMGEVFYELYEEAGVFKACEHEDWMERVPELSRYVTFKAANVRMKKHKADAEDPTNPSCRIGNDTRDAYARLLDRLQAFNRPYSIESTLYGDEDGMGIDELIGNNDDVVVLESKGLENTFKNFIFGIITSGFYKFALAHENGYLAEDQYETVLVIEEANEVLTGNDNAGTGGGQAFGLSGQSEFEQILDQAAGYGLFIFSITQKIADMPSSIIANSGMKFIGRLARAEDVTVAIRSIAREERYEDRDLVKWFPRSPIGWFVCQSSRGFDFKLAEPILVKIAQLNMSAPSNKEIEEILTNAKANNLLRQANG